MGKGARIMSDNIVDAEAAAQEFEASSVKYNSKLVGVTFEGRQDVIALLAGDEPNT